MLSNNVSQILRRPTLVAMATKSNEFSFFIWVFGVKESTEIIFRVKIACNGELQDGHLADSDS